MSNNYNPYANANEKTFEMYMLLSPEDREAVDEYVEDLWARQSDKDFAPELCPDYQQTEIIGT